ncbi:uncharacterized protein J3R85_017973 [Psidium guajava]|nr:uncharacterized protein J3R85_017973 [Psidium guajava]
MEKGEQTSEDGGVFGRKKVRERGACGRSRMRDPPDTCRLLNGLLSS